jgi:aspartate/methionine/tyrosine aminotransferase
MSPAELNAILEAEHPAAAALLSPLGRRAALPLGIPQQSAQAAHCARRASIGQITRGDGTPIGLPSLLTAFANLSPRDTLLYAPQPGIAALREAWRQHAGLAGWSLPVVVGGLTHGLSLCADLFCDPERPLLLASPYWDNYDNIATMRLGARIETWPFYGPDGRFGVADLAALLARQTGPATVVLNFPSNPSGYSPFPDEVEALVRVIRAHPHPLCVVCDDAYHGLWYEPETYRRSVYFALAEAVDPERVLVAKVDGASKELVFFGGRVAFLTFSARGAAGEALAEKAAAVLRGTVSSVSAPAQHAVLRALRSPTLAAEQAEVVGVLARRYRRLKTELDAKGLRHFCFNSGFFALLPVREGQDCEQVRRRLIAEQSTGVIAVPGANALRVAFSSVEEDDIPDLVTRIAAGLG